MDAMKDRRPDMSETDDGCVHSPTCWRLHMDCAERLLSEAADALAGVLDGMLDEGQDWYKDERALLARLRAALEDDRG